ncbi:hypothetical protein HZS_1223, partial [Henneguya salminicola]
MVKLELDRDEMLEAYNKIRNSNEITWVAFGYKEDYHIGVLQEGTDYEELMSLVDDNSRLYIFGSVSTGDEMSIRKKFYFISWIGEKVAPKKKAAVSTHKGEVKMIIDNFSVELQASSKDEIKLSILMSALKKAGGADY